MGELVTKPYSTSDGTEYVAYLQHIISECERLTKEGRLPDDGSVLSFFDDVRMITAQVRGDVARAASRGEQQVVSRFQMTRGDHRRLTTMSESVGNLLEILELRGAVALHRTEGSIRAAEAVRTGQFEDG